MLLSLFRFSPDFFGDGGSFLFSSKAIAAIGSSAAEEVLADVVVDSKRPKRLICGFKTKTLWAAPGWSPAFEIFRIPWWGPLLVGVYII